MTSFLVMNVSDVQTILRDAEKRLGSLESPNYSRVRRPDRDYCDWIERLSEGFWIRDTTDVNYDFSTVFLLTAADRHGDAEFLLQISWVLPLCFAMRLEDGSLVGDGVADTAEAKAMGQFVSDSGLKLVSKEVLSAPLSQAETSGSGPTLFALIFSDLEHLPWADK